MKYEEVLVFLLVLFSPSYFGPARELLGTKINEKKKMKSMVGGQRNQDHR